MTKRKQPKNILDNSEYQQIAKQLDEVDNGITADSKLPTTFKLKKSARLKLLLMSREWHISQADILAILIHSLYDGYDKNTVENWIEHQAKV